MSRTTNEPTVYGLDCGELPEGEIPLEAVVVLKALTEDGEPCITVKRSDGLMSWDEVGMLTLALDKARASAQEGFIPDDDEDQEDDDDGE